MERFEFVHNGIKYIVYVTTDSDDSGNIMSFDASRDDDKDMLPGEENVVRAHFNSWYYLDR